MTSGRAFDRHNAVARLIGSGRSVAAGAAGGTAGACGFSLSTGVARNCRGPGSGAGIASLAAGALRGTERKCRTGGSHTAALATMTAWPSARSSAMQIAKMSNCAGLKVNTMIHPRLLSSRALAALGFPNRARQPAELTGGITRIGCNGRSARFRLAPGKVSSYLAHLCKRSLARKQIRVVPLPPREGRVRGTAPTRCNAPKDWLQAAYNVTCP